MNKTITKFKPLNHLKYPVIILWLTLGIVNLQGQAAAPWCDGSHPYQNAVNGYNSTLYLIALEQVIIRNGTTVIINAPADGFSGGATCGMEYRLQNSPSNAIELTAGNSYTIDASSSASTTYITYYASYGLYIDFNNDKDFLDAGEFLGEWKDAANGTAYTPRALVSKNFSIPCNINPSATRLRLICNYYGYVATAAMGCKDCSAATPYYGETKDFSINLVLPSSVSASFVAPTEAWVKTVIKFINNNQSGYTQHALDANNDGTW